MRLHIRIREVPLEHTVPFSLRGPLIDDYAGNRTSLQVVPAKKAICWETIAARTRRSTGLCLP